MRYESTFSIHFDAQTDGLARTVALEHLEQIQDLLRVEGADSPYEITLDRLSRVGGFRQLLANKISRPIERDFIDAP